ncbi:putative 28S rRNA (cytosine-C(5))-methyltransferase [Holothuria leucospilota]|uniref:28S rRNA (Cytosine-C(5))-methyltransferase n=1 Tax=Holothuria leucospilota TaxID=206669 RepID=A0A9Q0YIJ2_HOLLE|nr:putative 28S rRNA (cytosine-C(5))-methyltransferase [Holothuria leucospilota]
MALYLAAAKILEASEFHGSTLKTLIYESDCQMKGALNAVTLETQRHLPIIEKLLDVSGADKSNKELSKWMLRVVTYDLLFGEGLRGVGKGSIRRAIRPQQRALKDALKKLKEEMGVRNHAELLKKFGIMVKEDPMPRWARVNLLKNTYKEVEEELINEGFTCIMRRQEVEKLVEDKDAETISTMMIDYINSLKQGQFMADFHLPDVLVFAPRTHLFEHYLYKECRIILMDKSSCIPAYVLAPPEGSEVIDSCAAPGNKTNHLGCMMNNTGKIYAFDLDKKRAELLSRTVSRTETNAEVAHSDFLEIDPSDPKYARISHVLVDPSCSGSGIISRKDHLMSDRKDGYRSRLKYLRGIQLRILNHALKFPNVKKIVYSTCSVNTEENEEVVLKILESHDDVKLKKVLPSWSHRPSFQLTEDRHDDYGDNRYKDLTFLERRETLEKSINKNCIKASFEKDKTNGFFVALLSCKKGRMIMEEDGSSYSREDIFSGMKDEDVTDKIDLEETPNHAKGEDLKISIDSVRSGRTEIPCSHTSEGEKSQVGGEDGRKVKKKKKKKTKEIDEKLENGEKGRDWLDVIDEAENEDRKRAKKKKKKDSDGYDEITSSTGDEGDVNRRNKDRKSKRNADLSIESNVTNLENDGQRERIKEKKRKKAKDESLELKLESVMEDDEEEIRRKKEKKKKKSDVTLCNDDEHGVEEEDDERQKKKRNRKRKMEDNGLSSVDENETIDEGDVVKIKKKKKKDKERHAAS